jgi:hypothetical protein
MHVRRPEIDVGRPRVALLTGRPDAGGSQPDRGTLEIGEVTPEQRTQAAEPNGRHGESRRGCGRARDVGMGSRQRQDHLG